MQVQSLAPDVMELVEAYLVLSAEEKFHVKYLTTAMARKYQKRAASHVRLIASGGRRLDLRAKSRAKAK
jgi:hypothetical protein